MDFRWAPPYLQTNTVNTCKYQIGVWFCLVLSGYWVYSFHLPFSSGGSEQLFHVHLHPHSVQSDRFQLGFFSSSGGQGSKSSQNSNITIVICVLQEFPYQSLLLVQPNGECAFLCSLQRQYAVSRHLLPKKGSIRWADVCSLQRQYAVSRRLHNVCWPIAEVGVPCFTA